MLDGMAASMCHLNSLILCTIYLLMLRYYDHKKQAAKKEKKTIDASKMVREGLTSVQVMYFFECMLKD